MFKPVQKKGVLSREELETVRNKKEPKKKKPFIKRDKAQKATKSKKQKLSSAFKASTFNVTTTTKSTNVTLNSTQTLSNFTTFTSSTTNKTSTVSTKKLGSKTTILPTTSIATTTAVITTKKATFTLSGSKVTNNGVISVSGYFKGDAKYSKDKITDGQPSTFWHSKSMAASSWMNYVLNNAQTITDVTVSKRAGSFHFQADSSWFNSYF